MGRVDVERDLEIDQREHRADDAAEQQQHAEIVADIGVEQPHVRVRQRLAEPARASGCDSRACGLQQSRQRVSSEQHSEQIAPGIGRAVRHVLGLELVLADRAADHAAGRSSSAAACGRCRSGPRSPRRSTGAMTKATASATNADSDCSVGAEHAGERRRCRRRSRPAWRRRRPD